MSSPPGVQAGSPQQGRWTSACCAQPEPAAGPPQAPPQGPALSLQPSAARAPRLSMQLSPRARLPKPSQHHSQAGGWTGTAMRH
ncbi:hypothetical protein HaLaN_33213 [Haematococcus lacustris]|uniref:Uncharacterized protein n=1 Tax=Haematococcus lacustris TaxID=44745 RepID=A0A6A0AM03_HAELA|nr:hypothetical protein HaLaN_33213 [Haematococcus lacustris]